MPTRIGRWIAGSAWFNRIVGRLTRNGLIVNTTGIIGFTLLWMMAMFRPMRPRSFRFGREQVAIDAWLERASVVAPVDYDLACEIIETQRVLKGYGETHHHSVESFTRLMAAADALVGQENAAPTLVRLREAALADEDGQALERELSRRAGNGGVTTAPANPLPPPAQRWRGRRLPRRLIQLTLGLVLLGVSIALIVRSTLGVSPWDAWDVFHGGVQLHTGASFGAAVIAVGIVVLLLWIPLRQRPGVGTVANVLVVGLSIDATLALLAPPHAPAGRITLVVGGITLNALAGALYLGAGLGPSARDGLMTGLARRTGRSLRLIRTVLELTVLVVGAMLSGAAGIGTVLYAVTIGPLVQFFLPSCTVRDPNQLG